MGNLNMEARELEPGINELNNCFYCKNSLPANNREHIFNACWGGRHKTSKLICDQCNTMFSSIDRSLNSHTDFILNANGITKDRRKEVTEIDLNEDYKLTKGLKPELKESKITIDKTHPEGIKTNIVAPSRSKLKKLLSDMDWEKNIGRNLTDEEQKQIDEHVKHIKIHRTSLGETAMNFQMDLQDQYRSISHTILKCMFLFIPIEEFSKKVDRIKKFAHSDIGKWDEFAVDIKRQITFSSCVLKGAAINNVEIHFSKKLRKIIGVLNILNRFERAIIVSDDYDGPDKICIIFEDTDSKMGGIEVRFPQEQDFISLQKTTEESVANQLAKLIEKCSYDVLYTNLGEKIEPFLLGNKSCNEVKKDVFEFLEQLAKLLKIDISSLDLENKVEIELSNLCKLQGKERKERFLTSLENLVNYLTITK